MNSVFFSPLSFKGGRRGKKSGSGTSIHLKNGSKRHPLKYYIIVQHNNKLRYQGTEAKIIYDVLLTGCKSKFYEDEVKMHSLNMHFKD